MDGPSSPTTMPGKETEIKRAFHILGDVIDSLELEINNLSTRLEPISVSVSPKPMGEPVPDREPMTELGKGLHVKINKLKQLRSNIRDMFERIEL